jgi:toxin CcdB
MAQYDVHRNTNKETAEAFPYVVNIQADLVSYLDTRLVVPLGRPSRYFASLTRLIPVVEVEDEMLLFMPNHAVSLPRAGLGPVVGNIEHSRFDLLGAIDFLLTGV